MRLSKRRPRKAGAHQTPLSEPSIICKVQVSSVLNRPVSCTTACGSSRYCCGSGVLDPCEEKICFCHICTYYNLLLLYTYGDKRVFTTNSGMYWKMTAVSPKFVAKEFVCGEFVHKRKGHIKLSITIYV
jgi:hypothetical protein